jgi:superoxide dismutase, Cu-Zn family
MTRTSILLRVGLLSLLPAMLIAACATEDSGKPGAASATPAVTSTTTTGTYVAAKAAAAAPSNAYIYDALIVPSGSSAEVTITTSGGSTKVSVTISGYLPNRAYGAHLHAKACGVDPKDSGPHYQYKPDPAASTSASVDPQYANATNEVWLDFTTDATGKATASTEVPWQASADRRPAALVIHAEHTHTEAGKAGSAGARASCLTLSQ